MNDKENDILSSKISEILNDKDLIFRIGKKLSFSEKLQLIVLKLLILLWEQEDTENVKVMEEELKLIDDIRHELSFMRARLYKKILEKKAGFF